MGIDYNTLGKTLFQKKKITVKKHAEYLEDEDALPNDVAAAETILSLGWDGNAPGCSGAIWVNRWKGLYFCTSSDYDPEGPFESLDEALGMEWFYTATSNPEINSEALPLKKLLGIGRRLVSEDGDEIYINGTRYVLKADTLVKPKEAK